MSSSLISIPDEAIAALSLQARPYFAARQVNGETRTEGQTVCRLGSRIPMNTGPDDGIFIEWQWDGRRLTVRNDRYGIYPLFYASHGGEIRISPAIGHVLAGSIPRDLDETALSVLLWMNHCVGEDTPFKAVRFLPPDSTLVWEAGELTITQHPLHVGRADAANLTFDAAVDEYIALFHQAIGRRLPEDTSFTVPLSGGRDSRHILFALHDHGFTPAWCPTVRYRPPATNEDERVAAVLCDELGITHEVIEKADSWLRAVVREVHLTNFCGGGHGWILPVAAHLQERCTTMYDGLAGSVLSGGFLTDEHKMRLFAEGRFEELATVQLKEGGREGFVSGVLRGGLGLDQGFDAAVARMVDELKRHSKSVNPILSFVFWNRTRRMVASIPYSILGNVPTVHTPYLDHAVFDFLTHVNSDYLLDNRLHDAAIERGYPKYSHIPYENKARRAHYQSADHAYFRQSLRELLRYLVRQGRPLRRSGMVRKEYVAARALLDLARPKVQLPWYLMGTVYAMELEWFQKGSST